MLPYVKIGPYHEIRNSLYRYIILFVFVSQFNPSEYVFLITLALSMSMSNRHLKEFYACLNLSKLISCDSF